MTGKRQEMNLANKLTDEEKAIIGFVQTYFERQGMFHALEVLRNPDTKLGDLRTVIVKYRKLYETQLN